MFREVKAVKDEGVARDYVAEERDLRLIVNDKNVATVKLSPGNEEEFAIGYCLGEGLVKGLDAISEVRIDANTAYVEANADFDVSYERYILSDCITGWRARIKSEYVKVTSGLKVSREDILKSMRELMKRSYIWRKTGGVHSVALANKGEFLLVEDISRHVAIDKVIGLAAKKGLELSNSYILTSGRLPGDIVIKVARVNVPIIASRTAPLSSGVECAEETGLTLVGFVRGRRMNIYTHPERIF
jgi:formate dehydrogenase accessory protein FdhD